MEPHKLLLIEDEQGLVFILKDRLENEGFLLEASLIKSSYNKKALLNKEG